MKPYTRGKFRAAKLNGRSYFVQVQAMQAPGTWITIDSFDYAGNARQRVRNLHAACCLRSDLVDMSKPDNEDLKDAVAHDMKRARTYIKTGKLRKGIKQNTY